jgi:hypothetical protein
MLDTLNSKLPVCFGKLDATEVHRVLLKKRNRWIAIVAIVIVPCFHEVFALEAPKMPSELKDSGFVSMELLLKDSERVFLPISELGESVREGGMDIISSGQKAGVPFTPQSKPMSGDGNKQQNDGADKGDEDWSIYISLLLMFWGSFVVLFLSDTKLSRRYLHTPNTVIR